MGIVQKFKASVKEYNLHAAHRAALGTTGLFKGQVRYLVGNKRMKRPAAGVVASIESGGDAGPKIKVGRVAAGAIIAGPVGAVVGGLLRKNVNRVYVTVTFPDGETVDEDVPVKEEREARAFVSSINAAGRHYASLATE